MKLIINENSWRDNIATGGFEIGNKELYFEYKFDIWENLQDEIVIDIKFVFFEWQHKTEHANINHRNRLRIAEILKADILTKLEHFGVEEDEENEYDEYHDEYE